MLSVPVPVVGNLEARAIAVDDRLPVAGLAGLDAGPQQLAVTVV